MSSDESVFKEWSNAQLKEYITENGYKCSAVERDELVKEAARISREVEAKVLKGSPSRAPIASGDKYPSTLPAGGERGPYGAPDNLYGTPAYPAYPAYPGPAGAQPAGGALAYPAFPGAAPTVGGPPPYPPYPGATGGPPPYPGAAPAAGGPPPYPAYPPYPGGSPGPSPSPGYPTAPAYPAAPAYPTAPYPGAPYSAAQPPQAGSSAYPPTGPQQSGGSSSGSAYPPMGPQQSGGSSSGSGSSAYPPTGPQQSMGSSSGSGSSAYPSVGPTGSAYPPAPAQGGSAAAPAYPSPYGNGGGRVANGSSTQKPPTATPTVAADPARYGGVPAPMPPAGGPTKKALICGCNYFGTSAQLNGCVNDAKCMEYLLKSKFGYRPENILLMVDNHADPLRRPTGYNMRQGMTWLMAGIKSGDSLFFHFSGHGSQCRDYTGEESDGMNETLCPCDFKKNGEIVDDEINQRLVNPLPTGVKLHAVVDACHSGSTFDLPHHATIKNGMPQWMPTYTRGTRTHKGTAGGFCVQIGASKDSQVAADTSALSGTGVSTGAATYAFIQAIEHRSGSITYGQLLVSMHQTLVAATGGGSSATMGLDALLGALLTGSTAGYRGQEPVLSSCYPFDLNYKFDM